MTELFEITVADMLKEVEREIRMRQAVYPRQIADKKMTRAVADRRIAVLQALAEWLLKTPEVGS